MEIRQLDERDRPAVETFLLARRDSAMFLRENLRMRGLTYTGQPRGALYMAAVEAGRVVALLAHAWNGVVLVQAPVEADALARALAAASGRRVTGLSGPHAQVMRVRAALGLQDAPAQLDAVEDLYGLELAALRMPDSSPRLRFRAATEADRETLIGFQKKQCPLPTLYLLSDAGELDDDVGPYGKSLLYLVSNAFEQKRGQPLLGMARFLQKDEAGHTSQVDPELAALFARKVDGRPSLVIAGASRAAGSRSESESHGGFDNDLATMNSLLVRMCDGAVARPFQLRDLMFKGVSGSRRSAPSEPLSAARVAKLGGQPANTQGLLRSGKSGQRGG